MGVELVRVLVGPTEREFTLHKRLLCSASAFFRDSLDATPASLSSSFNKRLSQDQPSRHVKATNNGTGGAILWLPIESTHMFELFVLWLYQRRAFTAFINGAIASLDPDASSSSTSHSHSTNPQTLHWNLVRLHLFATKTSLPLLQDTAMDALQDLYLRCDWEVSPSFVHFLYSTADPSHAFRLRKWAVAMVAWTMALHRDEAGTVHTWKRLIDALPELADGYAMHIEKMAGSRGANMHIKNPQLRLPANRLRSEERFFGFRLCSFHSHRSVVGEGPCLHARVAAAAGPEGSGDVPKPLVLADKILPLLPPAPPAKKMPVRAKDEMESDDSDQRILSPVSLHIRDGFYLDCS